MTIRHKAAVATFALLAGAVAATAEDETRYRVVDGKVDAGTYNGYRRYHASCNHCHGADGMGSTFGPSLVERPMDIEAFRQVVLEGRTSGNSVMPGFGDDPNILPYVDDIHAYLQARADGALGRGRPARLEE